MQEETAYVIVEEVKTDGGIQRRLYNWKEEELEHFVYYPGSDGLRQKPLLSERIDTRIG